MTTYILTPVGATGPIPTRAVEVHGWDLAARFRLADEVERLLERLDNEAALRTKAQRRLGRVAEGLARIAKEVPEAAEVVAAVRDVIWGIEKEVPVPEYPIFDEEGRPHFPCGEGCHLCEGGQRICWDCQTLWPCPPADAATARGVSRA